MGSLQDRVRVGDLGGVISNSLLCRRFCCAMSIRMRLSLRKRQTRVREKEGPWSDTR